MCFDDRSIEYDATELDEMVLAYATTVHKAQGAEYPIVVMPIMMTHFMMLQRNALHRRDPGEEDPGAGGAEEGDRVLRQECDGGQAEYATGGTTERTCVI